MVMVCNNNYTGIPEQSPSPLTFRLHAVYFDALLKYARVGITSLLENPV